tara:strand:+ start:168 stop:392 length:225 start_codon:yes stop_codon:yes gene_type:complete
MKKKNNIIDAKAVFASKQLQSAISRDIDTKKYVVQVSYDCKNNEKYNWTNLEFMLVNKKTGAKSEIPVTSMFGN